MDIHIMDIKEASQRFKRDKRTNYQPPKAFFHQSSNQLFLICCDEREAIDIIFHETMHEVLYRIEGYTAHAKFDKIWKREIWLDVLRE